MTLSVIHAADLVLVDVRGQVFHAEVLERGPGRLRLRPLDRRVTHTTATSRQVVAHWRKSRASTR
jgi:hypothetical protein